MNAVDVAWAAGMFEGEGSVRINTPTARNLGALFVDLVSIDEPIPAFFRDRWGGSVRHVPSPAGNRLPYWRWRCASRQADAFLADIRPFMRVPRAIEKADLGREFQAQKRAGSGECRTDEYRQLQVAYYELMKTLNERGAR